HLVRQVAGHEVDVVGEVLPRAGDALDLRLAAELALGAYLAGHTGYLVGERGQRVGHAVDGLDQGSHLALGIVGDPLAQVASSVAFGDVREVAHLVRQVAGHEVDVVGEVLPRAGDALDLGLATELALGAHLAGHTGYLVGEGPKGVGHAVDG